MRRGKVGGYQDDIAPEIIARIDALVTERLDPRLGYGQRPDSRLAPGQAPGHAGGGPGRPDRSLVSGLCPLSAGLRQLDAQVPQHHARLLGQVRDRAFRPVKGRE